MYAFYLHQPSMIPSISYRNLLLIHSSMETDRTETYTPYLSIIEIPIEVLTVSFS